MITAEDARKRHVLLRYEGCLKDNTPYIISSALEKKGFVPGLVSNTLNTLTFVGDILYFFDGEEFGGKCPSESELKDVLNSVNFKGHYAIREGKKETSSVDKKNFLEILCKGRIY